ncbi:MAG TPA: MopE-related protein, partial [Chitinophagales bacterium]|nr:MopE-related protein [Chitinophagales bacterium]
YADVDGDGYGDPMNTIDTAACTTPVGYLTDNSDCNDANAAINPAATEICNGLDDNCNAILDEGFPTLDYYADADGDGFGNATSTVNSCVPPIGFVADSTDCDDTNPNVNPGVLEVSNNGIDDNCNGVTDEFGVGIDKIENSSSLIIFPNPAIDQMTLQLQLETPATFDVSLTVINVFGETVFATGSGGEKTMACINGTWREEISLDKKFTGGMYFVKLSTERYQWSARVMVIK